MATEPTRDDVAPDLYDDEGPDPRLVWRWLGRATRPVIGWILVGFGAFLVLLGWFGVSREAIVAKQIPYIVSGGIAGILLAVVGAYFLGTEELRKDSGRLDRLERMVEELHRTLLAGAAVVAADGEATAAQVPPPPPPPGAAGATVQDGATTNGKSSFVTLAGSDTYHASGCAMVEGKSVSVVVPSTVRRRDLQPCPLCEPVAVS